MNKNLIREELAKLLDLSPSAITDELQINQLAAWDSIVWVSLIAFLIAEFDCKIELQQLMMIQTVKDLWIVIETKIGVTQ